MMDKKIQAYYISVRVFCANRLEEKFVFSIGTCIL